MELDNFEWSRVVTKTAWGPVELKAVNWPNSLCIEVRASNTIEVKIEVNQKRDA